MKLLIYSYTTKEESNRILIAIFIYMAGIRFSMLSGSMNSPLYLGNILSNFSICISYFTIKNKKLQYINLFLLIGLFTQSFVVNSGFGLVIAIINLFIFIIHNLSQKYKEKKNGILIVMGILTLMLWVLSGFNLNAFFNIIETIMKLLPNTICNWIFKIFDPSLLPEQIMMKYILKTTKRILLTADY